MPLLRLEARDFRCLEAIDIELDPASNVFVGENASGKTSLLEAIFFLGRGRSFRTTRRDRLIRHGQEAFTLVGHVSSEVASIQTSKRRVVGIRGRRDGLETRIGGQAAGSLAELATVLPVTVIEPEVHKLIEEAPQRRRSFIDYGVFHVEHSFLETWRRFQRSLRQRNAALRARRGLEELRVWETEYCELGERLNHQRRDYVRALKEPVVEIGRALLSADVAIDYRPGWTEGKTLAEAIEDNRARDYSLRATRAGPHRGDLRITMDGHAVRAGISRGQQKLVAAVLLLAQLRLMHTAGRPAGVLLLDDPAAELDRDNLDRLMGIIGDMDVQLFVTALRAEDLQLTEEPRMFHVEQGKLREMV